MFKSATIPLSVALVFACAPVWAQNANAQQNGSSQNGASKESVRAELMDTLKKSGFTDLSVAPDSFLVHGKDKSGNPVAMFISPNSMTEVATVGSTGNQQQSGGGAGKFADVPKQDELSSKAVGANVYNNANQDIGAIKDVAIENNRVKAYIVGIGGFLGVGERYVAVRPSALKLTWNDSDKKWRGEMDATKQELQSAPEYKYASSM